MTTDEELQLVNAGLAEIEAYAPALLGGVGVEVAAAAAGVQAVINAIRSAQTGALTQQEAMTALSQLNSSITSDNAKIDAEAAAKFK